MRSTDPMYAVWEEERQVSWKRWCRNWLGLSDSPYRSIKWLIHLKMRDCGDMTNRTNIFHWERVVLNLPSTKRYLSDLPWVMKS